MRLAHSGFPDILFGLFTIFEVCKLILEPLSRVMCHMRRHACVNVFKSLLIIVLLKGMYYCRRPFIK